MHRTRQLIGAPPSWYAIVGLTAVIVVTTHLVALGTAPPGLFRDEAAFGYNGWTIAHFGTDEYGTPWPFFFRSFGDYKGPLGVYLEALLTSVLPLTPSVIRLPNAMAGILLAFASGWLAWKTTRSRTVALIIVAETSFEPWFFHLSRTMLEVDLFTPLCYVVALALLAAGGEQSLRSSVLAGMALGAACFTAQPGRFFTPLLLAIILFAFRRTVRLRSMFALAAPVGVAIVALVALGAGTTARLNEVSAFRGQNIAGSFAHIGLDLLQYLSPWLLFLHGDGNLRHTTGVEGLFLISAAVPVGIGLYAALRRRTEPIASIALLSLVAAAAAASLAVGVNARRDVVAMPAFVVLLTFGWQILTPWLARRRIRVAAAVAVVALALVPYYFDYAVLYPERAAEAFQLGGLEAMRRAQEAAGGHTVFVSQYISPDALVVLKPDPRHGDAFGAAGVRLIEQPGDVALATPGDILVLEPPDGPPPGATLLFQQTANGQVTVSVYRR